MHRQDDGANTSGFISAGHMDGTAAACVLDYFGIDEGLDGSDAEWALELESILDNGNFEATTHVNMSLDASTTCTGTSTTFTFSESEVGGSGFSAKVSCQVPSANHQTTSHFKGGQSNCDAAQNHGNASGTHVGDAGVRSKHNPGRGKAKAVRKRRSVAVNTKSSAKVKVARHPTTCGLGPIATMVAGGDKSPGSTDSLQEKGNGEQIQPKRPLNSFLCFGKTNRGIMQAEFPNLQNAMISKKLSDKWNGMSKEEKAP